MDIIRFILIFLIAGTAYYLLLQWPPKEPLAALNEEASLYKELEDNSKDSLSPLQPSTLSPPEPELLSVKKGDSFKPFYVENDVLKIKF